MLSLVCTMVNLMEQLLIVGLGFHFLTAGAYEECVTSLRNTVVYEGTENTILNCTTGLNGSSWSVRATSNSNTVYQITNYDDIVSPTLTRLYAINETGLIVRNATTTNATDGPISTAGVYTVQISNRTSNIAVKLVVIRSGPACFCNQLAPDVVKLSCTVIYADHQVAPIQAIMKWTVNGQFDNTTVITRTLNATQYVYNSTSTITVNNTVPATYYCQVTFAAPPFASPPYLARNVPDFTATCTGTTTTCITRSVTEPSKTTVSSESSTTGGMTGGTTGASYCIGIAVGGLIVIWSNSFRFYEEEEKELEKVEKQ